MENLTYLFILLISVGFVITACNIGNNHAANEANLRKAYEALSKRDYTTFASLCAEEFTELGLAPQPIKGVQASIDQYKVFLDAFPDLKFDITDIASAGKNKYFIKVHLTGTNTGSFMMLPPTSKKIDAWDMDIVELNEAGKCISHWSANPNASLIQIGYGSITNPSTGIVMAAYEAFGKADIQAVLALCTDDVVFDLNDRTLDSKERIYKGKEEVGKFFTELNSKLTYSKFQPVRFLADGDDVSIDVNVEYINKSNGKKYSSTYSHRFHVVNGKINMFRGLEDFAKML